MKEIDVKKLQNFKAYFEMLCKTFGINSALVVFELGEDVIKHHVCDGKGGIICSVNGGLTSALKQVCEKSITLKDHIH